jgi:hypothetical protein
MFERRRLELELSHWRRAGRRVQLWWRDDDAQRPTAALARLIETAERHAIPLTLAVVPVGCDPGLAAYLARHPIVSVVQHGLDHRNGRCPLRPSQFDDAAPVETVAAAIHAGACVLEGFQNVLPVYVPPWNVIQSNVRAALEWLSMDGLSAFGETTMAAAPTRIEVHLDLMRWKDQPRFCGQGRFLRRMRRLLRARRRAGQWREPIGLLTHHLDHDPAAWTFLEGLLAWPRLGDHVQWRSASELFQATAKPAFDRPVRSALGDDSVLSTLAEPGPRFREHVVRSETIFA